MNWDSIVFLLGMLWPYLAVAAAIGLVVGWWSAGPRRSGDRR